MNASHSEDVRTALEARGFRLVRSAAYQLTDPIPGAMHVNETRLHGLLTRPLLWLNQTCAALHGGLGLLSADRFDSWVMELVRE